MPIYEYRCTSCGHTLEVIQKFNDARLTQCTECAGPLEKLISRSAFLLKGGGWYSEGYGGGSGSGSWSSESPAASTPSTKPAPTSGESSDTTPKGGKKAAAGGGCGSGSCGCH